MNIFVSKVLASILILAGIIVIIGWMIVDIYGAYKLDIVFVAIGLIVGLMGSVELNHIELMEKLNELQKPT